MQAATSDVMRKLMRLVVTEGYGKAADVPGYFVGGKTGTAEKTGAHGYKKHANVSAFISVFPMQAPRYAVYMMLDEPHGNKSTGWYSTAGQVSGKMRCHNSRPGPKPSTRAMSRSSRGTSRTTGHSAATAYGKNRSRYAHSTGNGDGP